MRRYSRARSNAACSFAGCFRGGLSGMLVADRYCRTIGRVYAGTLDVSAEMVRQGEAWIFRRFNRVPPART
jgi:endonuclease YncB( thermonuclease family)